MTLARLQILKREPYEDGRDFGQTGPYERIDAIAHYTVDPANEANRGIVDLDNAVCDESGLVHFSGDATFLVPADSSSGNRAVLIEVPNRGNRALIDPANGFLLRRGWSIAWCGWQWDVPRTDERMGLEAPIVPDGRIDADSRMQLRLQPNSYRRDLPLTDQHISEEGIHERIMPVDVDDPDAVLMVRDGIYGRPTVIPHKDWRFAREVDGVPVSDSNSVWLCDGFEAGRIYDLLFRPKTCRVVGAGLLAVRDFGVYVRSGDEANPLRDRIDHVICRGVSQCGRFLRTYLHLGLNVDEDDRKAMDGILIWVAGGRRGEFNQRYGQPSVQPTPSFGHLFPFADQPQTDPASGVTAGLLDRQRARGGVPRILYADTSTDYWRGDASLTHIDATTGADVEPPEEVRRYLFASTAHSPGVAMFTEKSAFGTRGANYFNSMNTWLLFRATFVNLLEWVRGIDPPPSVFPRRANGTAATREAVLAKTGRITGLTLPDASKLPHIMPLDLGPGAEAGVGTFPASVAGDPYPCIVSDIDANGNETGGIRLPDIEVPIGTHTGFNPRHPETGGAGQLLEYIGSMWPFPKERILSDYPTRDDYLDAVRRAAVALAKQRYLLEEDVDLCVRIAGARYDEALGHG